MKKGILLQNEEPTRKTMQNYTLQVIHAIQTQQNISRQFYMTGYCN